jgi:hypothetical protein
MARERINVTIGQASIPIGRENLKVFAQPSSPVIVGQATVPVGSERPKIFTNQSNLVIRRIGDLADVNLDNNVNGAILVYNSASQTFIATNILSAQVIDGGTY